MNGGSKLNFWEQINNLYEKNQLICSDSEQAGSLFQICRFLSYTQFGFFSANEATRFARKLPDWAVQCYLYNSVPKMGRAPWIGKMKKAKEEKTNPVLLSKLGHALCCSAKHAEQTIEIFERAGRDPYVIFGLKRGKGE